MVDQFILTDDEQIKLDIINAVIEKKMKTGTAAKILTITPRQIQGLKKIAWSSLVDVGGRD